MSMKTIAVIDCLKNNRFSREPLSGGCSAERLCADAVLSAFRSGKIDGDVVRLSETPEAAGGIRTVAVSAADAGGYFDALAKITEGYEVALRVCGDAPFINPDLILETIKEHTETAADFTYGEGFPLGKPICCRFWRSLTGMRRRRIVRSFRISKNKLTIMILPSSLRRRTAGGCACRCLPTRSAG